MSCLHEKGFRRSIFNLLTITYLKSTERIIVIAALQILFMQTILTKVQKMI